MLQERESGERVEATMPVALAFDVSVIPLELRRSLKRIADEFMKGESGSMDNHNSVAVARSRNAEDITVFSDRPSKGRHVSRPSKDIHNIQGTDPSGGPGALGRPAPRLPSGHAADLKPPRREGDTLASRLDRNEDYKSTAQAEREELAKVLVGMGLDGKLPLSRHEMPSFKKKSKTKAT